MAHLALALLGPFHATLDGRPVGGLSSPRLRALLAYLAVECGREHPRELVASLLWPERPDREALSALRSALSNLHRALGDRGAPSPFVLMTRGTVQFNAASDHWLDVAEFIGLAGRTDVPGLERAASLYRGPFLHGLSLGDSPAFDDWLLLKEEEYRGRVLGVLGDVASLHLARGATAEAARWARRQLELEPYREQAHRQLMAALALGGERSAALAQYEAFRRLFARELGCEPEDETQALVAQIRDGTLLQPQAPLRVAAPPPPPVAASPPPARFVAREQELARLDALLEQALRGQGGVALIAGEAGGGKTALLDEFARRAAQARGDLIVLRGNCNAHGGAGDPYLPFREMLQTLAGDVEGKRAGGTLSPEQARRVWEALPAVGAALVEHGPDLVGRFVAGEALLRRVMGFGAPAGAGAWQARLREVVRRSGEGVAVPAPQADLFVQVTQVLHAVSVGSPLLLAVDDLQWADGGTAALLFHLGRRLAGSRILLACACRPEALDAREPSQAAASGIAEVLRELTREWGNALIDLDEADGRAFVEAYVDSEPNRLGAGFRQALYDHTGGNPLFTVELLRSFERDGSLVQDEAGRWVEAAALAWERWPPQVEAVIAGHLAALPDEDRALLQAAGVQGEQFAAEVAARALGCEEEAALRRLSGPLRTRHRLVGAVSLERAPGGQRLSHYRFRHLLVQRSAYRSLDEVARARLHEATAKALEAVYGLEGERPAALAPALARHYEAASLPQEAARHRLQAGRWAVRLVAYDEAIAHLERGLALLEGVPASPEQLRLELALCLAILMPAFLRRGWETQLAVQALDRLAELAQRPELEGDPQRLTALVVLAHGSTWSARPERGLQVGEQLLGLVQEGDRHTLLLAHWVVGNSLWALGQFTAAREHLERVPALAGPEAGRPVSALLAGDPAILAGAALGHTLWALGYPEQGRAALRQAVAQAEAAGDRPSAAFAHSVAGIAHGILGRDWAAAAGHAAALRQLGETGLVFRAWAALWAGQGKAPPGQAVAGRAEPGPEQALSRVAEAAPALRAPGSGVGQASLSLMEARLLMGAGEAGPAMEATDRARAWIERTGMRGLEAEAWRMRGELLLARSALTPVPSPEGRGEAEACFRRALEVAREQGARWLELRAAVGLARLWQAKAERCEARELLAGIYGRFTEGFDTVDLVEAKALLEELR